MSAATGTDAAERNPGRTSHAHQRSARQMGPGELLPSLDPSRPARARRKPEPHRDRRIGRLHRGPRRQAAARRLRRPLLRQCRLWPQGDRRRDRRAGARTRLLPRLCRPRHRGLDHARQDDPRPRARQHVEGLFRPRRLGRQRDQHQDGLVLQQRARAAGEEEDHLALARLSRLRPDDRLADRARRLPQEVRPAARPESSTPRRPTISAARGST